MAKFWSKYAPYCHLAGWLITIIFIAGMKWNDVAGSETQSTANSADIVSLKIDMATVKQDVHDIHELLFRGSRP
jgi:hypothetical protein